MTSSYSDILEPHKLPLKPRESCSRSSLPAQLQPNTRPGTIQSPKRTGQWTPHCAKNLLREGEGWLSEESVDDLWRLEKKSVWVVDPLDGTREFVQGIPEFCVSIAFVENGRPVAGGICNPATNETIFGAVDIRHYLQRQSCSSEPEGRPYRAL